MKTVIFYTKENCSLCVETEALLKMFQNDYSFQIEKRDISSNESWLEEYQVIIPVIEIDNQQLNCIELNYGSLEHLLKNIHY